MSLRDTLGREVPLAGPAQRVVSLVPSLTELLFALGCGAQVVGVSDYCVHPIQGLVGLPRVGGQKDPDLAVLRALGPDLVLCAKEENRKQDVAALEAAGVPVYVTDVRTVEAALALPGLLGGLCGATAAQVEAVARDMAEGVARAQAQAQVLNRQWGPVRVVMLIWRDPILVAGADTYIDDVLTTLGAENVGRLAGERRYPKATAAEIRALRPDVVLLPSEPYPFGPEHVAEMEEALGAPARCCDGTVACWYGPRTGRIGELADLLYIKVGTRG
jgi:ABC-type Fe3+-hydroxamate transport system substrate-binding protein